MEKKSLTQSDVSSNTQSTISTKCFKSAYSQATLHSFMNKTLEKKLLLNSLLKMVFLPVLSVKVNLSVMHSVIKACVFKKNLKHVI